MRRWWLLELALTVLAGLLVAGAGGCGRKVPSRPERVNPMDARSHPIAKAGADQTVGVGATVTLDGSGSTSPTEVPLHYHWTAPSGVMLSDTTVARPTFTAPAAGEYRFVLMVSDGLSSSVADEVVVTVRLPVAAAGPDQTVAVGMAVTLDGSISSASSGVALRFHWTAPSGATLSDTTAVRPTFTAVAAGEYRFSLVVSDGLSSSAADEVVVTVWPARQEKTFALPNGVMIEVVGVVKTALGGA
jgi:serine/threonine protein phosphatase PrpC